MVPGNDVSGNTAAVLDADALFPGPGADRHGVDRAGPAAAAGGAPASGAAALAGARLEISARRGSPVRVAEAGSGELLPGRRDRAPA